VEFGIIIALFVLHPESGSSQHSIDLAGAHASGPAELQDLDFSGP
jgi:hypothetical protein